MCVGGLLYLILMIYCAKVTTGQVATVRLLVEWVLLFKNVAITLFLIDINAPLFSSPFDLLSSFIKQFI